MMGESLVVDNMVLANVVNTNNKLLVEMFKLIKRNMMMRRTPGMLGWNLVMFCGDVWISVNDLVDWFFAHGGGMDGMADYPGHGAESGLAVRGTCGRDRSDVGQEDGHCKGWTTGRS